MSRSSQVTGASSGIGRAVAIALGRAGADVVVNCVSGAEGVQAVVDEINQCGCGRSCACRAEISKENEVQMMFALWMEE